MGTRRTETVLLLLCLLAGGLAFSATPAAGPSAALPELVLLREADSMPALHGLALDGSATVRLLISVPGMPKARVDVLPPTFGLFRFRPGAPPTASGTIQLNAQGRGVVTFLPPEYLPSTSTHPNSAGRFPTWVSQVTISVRIHAAAGATDLTLSRDIDLCRPPVLLVHGFTGSRQTLASFSTWLQTQGYDTHTDDYFNRQPQDFHLSGIEAQSVRLAANIAALCRQYREQGFLLHRVDVVSHSMGGLIARHLLRQCQEESRPLPIRKLIMIGTPNHGVLWTEKIVGQALAHYAKGYHQLAAEQLYSGHPFWESLNAGEQAGDHLQPGVEYANIIGLRSRYGFLDAADHLFGDFRAPADDDGVVYRDSAALNGVIGFQVQQAYHTVAKPLPEMFSKDDPLNRVGRVARLIGSLLQRPIPRRALSDRDLLLHRAKGEVQVRFSADGEWQAPPTTPMALGLGWRAIRTQDGKALLALTSSQGVWGKVAIPQHSEVELHYVGPQRARSFVRKGEAHFETVPGEEGKFEITLGTSGQTWTEFSPRARIRDRETAFVVSTDQGDRVIALSGQVEILTMPGQGARHGQILKTGEAAALHPDGTIASAPLPINQWWKEGVYQFDPSGAGDSDDTAAAIPRLTRRRPDPAWPAWEREMQQAFLMSEEVLHVFLQEQQTFAAGAKAPDAWEKRYFVCRTWMQKALAPLSSFLRAHPEVPVRERLALRYFLRRLEPWEVPVTPWDPETRPWQHMTERLCADFPYLVQEMESFLRQDPRQGHDKAREQTLTYLSRTRSQLDQARKLIRDIMASTQPTSWEDSFREVAGIILDAGQDGGLAAKTFAGQPGVARWKFALKGFKDRLKVLARQHWDETYPPAAWARVIEGIGKEIPDIERDLLLAWQELAP